MVRFLFLNCRVSNNVTTFDLTPQTEGDLSDILADAQRTGSKLCIRGGATKAAIGRSVDASQPLDMRGFRGIVAYDPAELVLTVQAGTLLSDVERLVTEYGQMLPFSPFDYGPIFGEPSGQSTVGGVVAAGIAGSPRVSRGSVRDHLLGFRGVSGRGEAFIAGAKVVKNVTGYDLSKLMCGSWGRLVALTELTFKVLPRPQVNATKAIDGLRLEEAIKAISLALGSKAEIAAASYFPGNVTGEASRTLFMIEGFELSVKARCEMLDTVLYDFGQLHLLEQVVAQEYWADLQSLRPLGKSMPIWRVNVPPREACAVIRQIDREDARWILDWGGGLIWIATNAIPEIIRSAAAKAGGHATLVRASKAMRDQTPAFQPQNSGVTALEARVRAAFDPMGVFETGRF